MLHPCNDCGSKPELKRRLFSSHYRCRCGRQTPAGDGKYTAEHKWNSANLKRVSRPTALPAPKGGLSFKPTRSSEAERITLLEQRMALMEGRLNALQKP